MVHIRRRSPLVACALALGLTLAPAMQAVPLARAAQPAVLHVLPDAAARLNAYLSGQARAHRFSGAVLLARGDDVLLSKGYGMADWSNGIHNSADTVFPAPGQVHEFAPAAVLWLEDAGKLHEGDHICAYIPRCPAIWAPITVHELLTHASGLGDFFDKPSQPPIAGQSLSLTQIVTYMSHEPMAHKPGTPCCMYWSGNDDIILQEYLVERVTGESYGTFLRQRFLGPLGLTHTHYSLHAPNVSQLAVGYDSWQQPASNIDAIDFAEAGGMIYSTLPDLFRWEQALHTGRVLSARSTARMLSPQAPPYCPWNCGEESTQVSVSDGWTVGIFRHHPMVEGWLGDFPGFWSGDRYLPDENVTVIDLSNLSLASPDAPDPYVTQADRAIFGS